MIEWFEIELGRRAPFLDDLVGSGVGANRGIRVRQVGDALEPLRHLGLQPAEPLFFLARLRLEPLALLGVHKREPRNVDTETIERRGLRSEIAEGLRYVLRHPVLRPIACSTATSNLFSSMGMAVLTVYMVRSLGMSPGLIGLALALGNIGFVVGAILTARLTALTMGGMVTTVPDPDSSMPSRFTTLKPVRLKETAYVPGRRSTILYCPEASVVTERTFSINSGLAASTVTPGITAPDVSLTTPAIALCA